MSHQSQQSNIAFWLLKRNCMREMHNHHPNLDLDLLEYQMACGGKNLACVSPPLDLDDWDFRSSDRKLFASTSLRHDYLRHNSHTSSWTLLVYLVQYPPKVWERTRKPYGKRRFSRRSQKSNFRRITMNLFLGRSRYGWHEADFFLIFPIKGRITLKSSPKFGNAP